MVKYTQATTGAPVLCLGPKLVCRCDVRPKFVRTRKDANWFQYRLGMLSWSYRPRWIHGEVRRYSKIDQLVASARAQLSLFNNWHRHLANPVSQEIEIDLDIDDTQLVASETKHEL